MKQQPSNRETEFVEFLTRLVTTENRAALAALRKGISSNFAASVGMCRYVAGWLVDADSQWDEQCFYLVASLFGKYPTAKDASEGFGYSFRHVDPDRQNKSADRRF